MVVKAFTAVIAVFAPSPVAHAVKAAVAVVADSAVTVDTVLTAEGTYSAALLAALSAEADGIAVVAGPAGLAELIRA